MFCLETNQAPTLHGNNTMNANFKTKLLLKLANKKADKGFTLIELLVVTIIVGVLAAVALPNLLGQVGKARETSAKNGIGTLNRAQQAYHFERQAFAPAQTANDLKSQNNPLGVVLPSEDFNFSTGTPGNNNSTVTAVTDNVNFKEDGTRAYGGAVAFNAGLYTNGICQSDNPAQAGSAPSITNNAVDTGSTACTGGKIVK